MQLEGVGGNVLVVGHGYFLRALLVKALMGLPPQYLRTLELSNASFIIISNKHGYWRLGV